MAWVKVSRFTKHFNMEIPSSMIYSKPETSRARRKFAWLALFLIVIAALAIVLTPAMLIVPFKAQTPRAVAISYSLKSWSPLATVLALIVSLALAVWLWRGKRSWWRRSLLVLSFVPLVAAAWFARQNHFEWMFNPLTETAYAKADQIKTVDDKDMVLAVAINGEAVAYPVREMAYHHVVHDTVGGVPIVATY
jgi:hypothetical protein